jgi:endoglucanase
MRRLAPFVTGSMLATALVGCAQFRPPPPEEAKARAASRCSSKAIIEDAEDGDDQINVVGGRGGYVYTFADEKGSVVEPKGDFKPASGGADGSSRSMRIHGKMITGEDAYAGVGLSFKEPEGPFDASRYTGVVFYAKRSAASSTALRFMIGDKNTDPLGKICTDCDNDFGVNFEVTEDWTRFEVSFADLKQEGGWGAPRPDALDKTTLYGLKWQVQTQGADFDVSIDQIAFVCGP